MIVLNASPYHVEKVHLRREVVTKQALQSGMPIVYVNLVGGQDELVFDGGSFVVNANSELALQAPFFEEGLIVSEFSYDNKILAAKTAPIAPLYSLEQSIYEALVLGLRDYVNKNHFKTAIIGLSGGIDSALTAAIAVDVSGGSRSWGINAFTVYSGNQ